MDSQFDAPAAELDVAAGAPLPSPQLTDPETGELIPPEPKITPADIVAAQGGVDAAFKAINAQPKERIRILKEKGPQVVIINGAMFRIAAGVFVEVPQQVAEILRESDRI